MAKFTLTVVKGVADVYPFGQQHNGHTLKEGQSIDLEVGPSAEPKLAEVAGVLGLVFDAIKTDLGAPAAGVAGSEPYSTRTPSTLEVSAVDGMLVLRTYAGSDFMEKLVSEGEKILVEITESNRITMAVYSADDATTPR